MASAIECTPPSLSIHQDLPYTILEFEGSGVYRYYFRNNHGMDKTDEMIAVL